jgi:hypothetical protein
MRKIIVEFPESQILDSKEGFFENCILISSPMGVDVHGSCAYLVNENWYNDVKSGKIADIVDEYDETTIEENLDVIWDDFLLDEALKEN